MEAIAPRIFTFADYLKLPAGDWVELIRGELVKMSPMPNLIHQKISGALFNKIYNHLINQPRQVFHPPFDVRLPGGKGGVADREITTVLQPDLTVVCDATKLDERGCLGAPDWVIEILSKGGVSRDTKVKFDIYQEAGVPEYWIVQPGDQTIIQYLLSPGGHYLGSQPYAPGDVIEPKTLPGLKIEVKDIFQI